MKVRSISLYLYSEKDHFREVPQPRGHNVQKSTMLSLLGTTLTKAFSETFREQRKGNAHHRESRHLMLLDCAAHAY